MSKPTTTSQINLYATPPHECSYLPSRQATTVFLDPHFPKDSRLYGLLSRQGFRRSGEHLYRPHCRECQACISVRVRVNEFEPTRSHRRTWKKNSDLVVKPTAPRYRPEHFRMYAQYISQRHRGGGMDNPTPDSFMQFLTSHWADTTFLEFRKDEQLIAVAVVDRLDNGLSAIYTFYDPSQQHRGLGTYAILWEINEAKKLGLEYLYLGYWIEECDKMNYKNNYKPVEYYVGGEWRDTPYFSLLN
ncbi:MAG: arginyltransferase [Pseudomonadota bacterium]